MCQTELEYYHKEIKKALDEWLEGVDNYHKHTEQFFTSSVNGEITHKATKSLSREEMVKIIEIRDAVEEKRLNLKALEKKWFSLRTDR